MGHMTEANKLSDDVVAVFGCGGGGGGVVVVL